MSNVLAIRNMGSKKQKKHNFYYLSRKAFKELKKENSELKVVGSTKLKVIASDKRNEIDAYLMLSSRGCAPVYFKLTKSRLCFTKGYICVDNNRFVAYSWLSFFVIPIIFLTILLLCFIFGNNGNGKIELDDFKPIDLSEDTPAVQPKTYDFQTQGSYTISSDKPKIKVWNPESNTRVFKYKVIVDNELLVETQGITPGNMVEVDCSSLLDKKGKHDLVLDLSVLDENSGKLVGQAQRNAVLTIN